MKWWFIAAVLLIAAGTTFVTMLGAGLARNSLSSLSFTYLDVGLHALGLPAGAAHSGDDRGPFCLGEPVEDGPWTAACIPPAKNIEGTCNPIATRSWIVTDGLFGPIDVRTIFAVSDDRLRELADRIRNFTVEDYLEFYGIEGAPLAPKTVTTLQCRGYGFVVVDQKFSEMLDAASLLDGRRTGGD